MGSSSSSGVPGVPVLPPPPPRPAAAQDAPEDGGDAAADVDKPMTPQEAALRDQLQAKEAAIRKKLAEQAEKAKSRADESEQKRRSREEAKDEEKRQRELFRNSTEGQAQKWCIGLVKDISEGKQVQKELKHSPANPKKAAMLKLLEAEIKTLIELKETLESNKPEKEKTAVMNNMKDQVKAFKKSVQQAKDFMK